MRALDAPPSYTQFVNRDEASTFAGVPLRYGGYWFSQGGWMRPASLAGANLAAAAAATPLRQHFNTTVAKLAFADDEWRALDADGHCIATAPVVVLANASDAAQLVDFAHPLQNIRGQVACVPAAAVPAPRAVITGGGYLLPAIDGVVVAGASYDFDDADPLPHASGRAQIAAQMAQMMRTDFPLENADGRVGFRCVAVDRLPLAGAVADVAAARANAASLSGAQADDLPRLRGVYAAVSYGSRGLIWSGLAAELIASQLEGEPAPIEADLLDALDPGRFVMKRLRHGTL